jgi:ParB-like chromosome segregation protein Spo0J
MAEPLFWQNRIVESGAASPQELAKGMHPLNWRGHPENQREALEEALDSLGILQPVLFNRQSGRVIDGHLRIELAVLKGQPLIPVNYVELTDDEEALALATLDAITEQAQPIPEKLAALLERTREMTADKPGLGAMLEALRMRASSEWDSINNPPPTLDQLENEYGDGSERDFWPYIKVQVPPETMRRWQFIIDKIPSDDEAQKVEILLGAVDESLLGSELS